MLVLLGWGGVVAVVVCVLVCSSCVVCILLLQMFAAVVGLSWCFLVLCAMFLLWLDLMWLFCWVVRFGTYCFFVGGFWGCFVV